MALARLNRKREETEGKGNCAFNAFALAITDEFVLLQIEQTLRLLRLDINQYFIVFLNAVSLKLGIAANWHTVKAALLDLRTKDKIELQNTLAPVLRRISMDIALNPDPSSYLLHQDRIYQPFLSAFENYRQSREKDEFFARHSFIIKKFDEVIACSASMIQQDKMIDQWWWKEGYNKFYEMMRNDGMWAGDVDLQRLADYFQVVLTILRDDEEMGTHGDYGYLPLLEDECVQKNLNDIYYCLFSRNIITRNQRKENDIILHPFNMDDIKKIIQRLMKVPSYEHVLTFIEAHYDNLKKQLVPASWSKHCIQELIQRNVVGRGADGKSCVFLLDSGSALLEIDEIANYKEVAAACRMHHRARASIVLFNDHSVHWENTQAIMSKDEVWQRRITYAFGNAPPSIPFWNNEDKLTGFQRRSSDECVVRRLT